MMMQPVPQAPLPEGVPPLFPIPLAAVPPFGASPAPPWEFAAPPPAPPLAPPPAPPLAPPPASPVKLCEIIGAGLVAPGPGALTCECYDTTGVKQSFVAELFADGTIRDEASDATYKSPSAWASACKGVPANGWQLVKFRGRSLGCFRKKLGGGGAKRRGDGPAQPINAFFSYVKENFKTASAQLGGAGKHAVQALAQSWRTMGPAEKRPFAEISRLSSEEYRRAKAEGGGAVRAAPAPRADRDGSPRQGKCSRTAKATLTEMLTQGLVEASDGTVSLSRRTDVAADLRAGGAIHYQGTTYATPSGFATSILGKPCSGFTVVTFRGVALADIRERGAPVVVVSAAPASPAEDAPQEPPAEDDGPQEPPADGAPPPPPAEE